MFLKKQRPESTEEFIRRLRSEHGSYTVQAVPSSRRGWGGDAVKIYHVSPDESGKFKAQWVENMPKGMTIESLREAFRDYASARAISLQAEFPGTTGPDVCRVYNQSYSVSGLNQFQVFLG
ncbi:MAG: hypothetical protein LRZ85_10440 [Alphaproteobacteria bacterium]|nr:hypothetical protein [Alphaproteobacteria bacterium]MCD8571388.1 hypothetical protein [Alphaproteobacteria bacterium]